MLVMVSSQVGMRFTPSIVKLLVKVPSALFPNAQYPDIATVKKVAMTIV